MPPNRRQQRNIEIEAPAPGSTRGSEMVNAVFAVACIVGGAMLGYRFIGMPPVVIVGGSGFVGSLPGQRPI
jgi:hypothetical protein